MGGVLRKEKTKAVMMRTALLGQPRSRTNTKSCCKRKTTSNFANNCVGNKECCGDKRIPNCDNPSEFTGKNGNPSTCVPMKCNCC